MDLRNKVAIVTGASKGIGKEVALGLAKEKCNLVLVGRDIEALSITSDECKKYGVDTIIQVCDLSVLSEIPNIVETTKKHFGKINIVVNNAGYYQKGNPYTTSLDEWDRSLAVLLKAPYHLTNMAIKEVPEDEGGAILFNSSIAGKITYKTGGAYCMAKHGLAAYANCLFEDLREKNIRVSTFYAGFVNTEMGREDHLDPEKMIQPEEFAEQMVFFLKNSQSSCIREVVVSPRVSPRK